MRRPDWASRMFGVIEAQLHEPFSFESNYCGLFVARVIDAMTDSDYAAQLGERCRDQASVDALLAEFGGLEGAVTHYLGEPDADPKARPRRGDAVLFDGGDGDSVGIWDGRQIVAVGARGLHKVGGGFLKVWRT